MTQRLRWPFLIAAMLLAVLSVALELGASGFLGRVGSAAGELVTSVASSAPAVAGVLPPADDAQAFLAQNRPPGLAIRYLALFDALLLLSLGLMTASLLVPQRVLGRVAGIVMLVISFLLVLAGIVLVLLALFALVLMVSLFLAVPFGTAAYMAIYGSFARGAAGAVLATLVTFKVAMGVFLLLAHQRFLQNRGLVILLLGSLLLTLLVGFLHGMVPGFLVSITDALGAIVVGIVAVVWALLVMIGSLVAVVKTVKLRT